MPTISKVLIANRGEIAVRIARTLRSESIGAVIAYAADEATSPATTAGDEAVALPGSGPAAYLDIEAIINAALSTGCDAIHPGYGFLSENADLAHACSATGVTFIGPSASQLTRFGDKVAARALAASAGVPVMAASAAGIDVDEAHAFAAEHGAMMLKAVSGGGGRGIRPILLGRTPDGVSLVDAFAAATREAQAAFGDGRLYAEALMPHARHIEVQIIGDGIRAEHLHERECSIQRNRQKLIEFAPAWWLDEPLRVRLHDAAVRIAEHAGYDSIGTMEFLVAGQDFAFIECNARLQVEHTVTEAATGVDLVALQIGRARGQTLAELGLFAPPAITRAAIQMRVNAETLDDHGRLLPTSGTVTAVSFPDDVRVDTFLADGHELSVRYDSLLAKVIVADEDTDEVFTFADAALAAVTIEGVTTNVTLLRSILADPDVAAGRFDTTWFERHADRFGVAPSAPPPATSDPVAAPREDVAPTAVDPHGWAPVVVPMPGTVAAIEVGVGDEVAAGTAVVVLESMKMEHLIAAPISGVVRSVSVTVGEALAAGATVVAIEPAEVRGADAAADVAVDLDHIRPDLAEVIARHDQGRDEHRHEAVAKRRKLGKRTARENVGDLLDPGSLIEYGGLVVAAQRKRRSEEDLRANTPGDGLVGGIGTVGGTAIAVASYDYTVLAGTQGLNNHRKKDRLFEVAEAQRLPFVFFTEGGGGRPGDTDGIGVAGLDCLAFAYFGRLSGLVPTVGIASGRCFAGNAAILGCCDVVIATADANIGMGGPAMIEGGGLGVFRPEEIGPVDEQIASGVIDIAVADEAEAVAVAKQYLGYFTHRQVEWACADQRLLRSAIPENRVRVYDIRSVIDTLFDTDSVLELRRGFGLGMVTAFARIEGRSVGVIANDPAHLGGAIDSDAADKSARFMQLCDAHDIPIVFLCDTPGFMVGPEAERTGLVRHASRLFVTAAGLRVPYMTVVVRKGYGLGAQAMAGGSFHAPLFIVGWPTSEFGGMGLEGAVRLGYRKELEAIEDPVERDAEFNRMVDHMYEVGKGVRMAQAFEIDDVIDPVDTRRWISTGLAAAPAPEPRTGKKRANVDTW